jgi:hypothetical protein
MYIHGIFIVYGSIPLTTGLWLLVVGEYGVYKPRYGPSRTNYSGVCKPAKLSTEYSGLCESV